MPAASVDPLLKSRETIARQIADLDRQVMQLARRDTRAKRLMTAPGVGAITALCCRATINGPARFERNRDPSAPISA